MKTKTQRARAYHATALHPDSGLLVRIFRVDEYRASELSSGEAVRTLVQTSLETDAGQPATEADGGNCFFVTTVCEEIMLLRQ